MYSFVQLEKCGLGLCKCLRSRSKVAEMMEKKNRIQIKNEKTLLSHPIGVSTRVCVCSSISITVILFAFANYFFDYIFFRSLFNKRPCNWIEWFCKYSFGIEIKINYSEIYIFYAWPIRSFMPLKSQELSQFAAIRVLPAWMHEPTHSYHLLCMRRRKALTSTILFPKTQIKQKPTSKTTNPTTLCHQYAPSAE